jgi:hypothetical protein
MSGAVMENFYASLGVMAKGMGGIFIVLFLIFLLIKGLIILFPEKK